MASSFSQGLSTFMQCFKAPAIKLFSEHLQAHPDHFDSWMYRGISHQILGNSTEAIKDFEKAANYGSPCERLVVQGLSLQEQGKHSDAATLFERATKIHSNEAIGWHFYGIQCGNSEVAIIALQNAIKLNYRFSGITHYFLGQLLLQKGETYEAIDQFRRGLRHDPTCTVMYIALGGALMKTGSDAKAKELLLKALELNDTQIEANRLLASLYARENNHAEAAKHQAVYLAQGGELHHNKEPKQQHGGKKEGATAEESPKSAGSYTPARYDSGKGKGGDGGSGDGNGSDDDWVATREEKWREIKKKSLKKGVYQGVTMYRIENPNEKGKYIWVSKDTAGHAGSGFKVWKENSKGNKLEFDSSYDHRFQKMTNKHESNAGKVIKMSDMNFR